MGSKEPGPNLDDRSSIRPSGYFPGTIWLVTDWGRVRLPDHETAVRNLDFTNPRLLISRCSARPGASRLSLRGRGR
jgi:hypothetical protein